MLQSAALYETFEVGSCVVFVELQSVLVLFLVLRIT